MYHTCSLALIHSEETGTWRSNLVPQRGSGGTQAWTQCLTFDLLPVSPSPRSRPVAAEPDPLCRDHRQEGFPLDTPEGLSLSRSPSSPLPRPGCVTRLCLTWECTWLCLYPLLHADARVYHGFLFFTHLFNYFKMVKRKTLHVSTWNSFMTVVVTILQTILCVDTLTREKGFSFVFLDVLSVLLFTWLNLSFNNLHF